MATISGNVIDVITDLSMPGTTVQVLDKNGNVKAGMAADNNGYFEISHPVLDDPFSLVVFSHVGYTSRSMSPGAVADIIDMVPGDAGDTGVIGTVTAFIKKATKKDLVLTVVILVLLILLSKHLFKV